MCSNDVHQAEEQRVVIEEIQAVESPFAMGERVQHVTLGEGTVQRIATDSITVLFDGEGYKTLALGLVLNEGLLQAVGKAEQSVA